MNSSIRIAVVGCGRVAQHYRKVCFSNMVSGGEIVGFCDLRIEKARDFAKDYGAEAFVDYERMLVSLRPNLVLVLTPSGHHYAHSKLALQRGCHVLVEKPATMIAAQARELVELSKSRKLMYGVAFQNRLNPAISCLRSALENKRFGKIVTATIRLRWCRYQEYYEDGWHGTWAEDGGVINQQAIHHLDALNWLQGPIESVCSVSANRVNSLEAEDTLVAVLRFESGAIGTIEATTAARPEDFEASLSIVGERGLAVIGGIALNKIQTWRFVEAGPGDEDAISRFSREVPNGYGLSHSLLLQRTLNALRAGSIVAPVPVEHAMVTTELVHALYRSNELGRWVKLSERPNSAFLGR
jgi:UDP-N-acetyl-2-amino-2-deoxyglucuronate dehydrogenase